MNKRVSKGSAQRWLSMFFLAAALLIVLPLAAFAQGAVAVPTPCDPEDPNCCPGPFCPPPRVVRGTVRSCAGVGLAGVTVEIMGDKFSDTVWTSASGFYSVTVPAGTYTVTPTPPTGYFFSPQSRQSSGSGFSDFTRYPRDNRANFDGDCRTDLSTFRPNNGVWYSVNSSNLQHVTGQFGLSTDIPTPGDYDADGKTDRAIFRPSAGQWWVEHSSNGSVIGIQLGQSGDIPVARDYNGDARTDFAVFRPSHGDWYFVTSETHSSSSMHFGSPGDIPVPGDYDFDNITDLAVFRPSHGAWYIRHPDGLFHGIYWGSAGDRPVQADYDGDGRTDIAVFIGAPDIGQWWILLSSTNYEQWMVLHLGLSSDYLVPGDYDGDGKADAAVWRASTGSWLILQGPNWTVNHQYFGSSADVPVPLFYIPQ
jgi:hypothetical protein